MLLATLKPSKKCPYKGSILAAQLTSHQNLLCTSATHMQGLFVDVESVNDQLALVQNEGVQLSSLKIEHKWCSCCIVALVWNV